MSSKWWLAAVCAVLVAAIGCGLKVGESSPTQTGPSFSGKGYSCVGQIPQHFENYVADELNDQQISDFMHCLQRAFTTFSQLTRGKEADSYTPQEIRRFLQTYFFKERPITQQLAHEFMVLKQVMIGGDTERITRAELTEFIAMLEDVRQELIRLRPHLKFLNPRLIVNQDPAILGARLAGANDALKASIRVVADRLERGKRDYPLENMESLVREFRAFVRWDDVIHTAHPAKYWVDFLRVFKKSTVSQLDPDIIHTAEWSPMLQSLARWYLAYIQYQSGVKNQPVLYGSGLQNTMHLAEEVFTLTEDAVRKQKCLAKGAECVPTLSMVQISSLVAAAQNLKWVPSNVRAQSVDRVLHALLDKVFAKADNETSKGLTLENVAIMKSEFYRWAYVQMRLTSNFNLERIQREESRPKAPSLTSSFFVPLDVKARLATLKDADWEHFLKIKQLARPLFNDNLNRVTLVPGEDLERFKVVHEFNNLSMMNVFRTMVGAMFRGYAAESNRRLDWGAGLKSEELQRFYEDVRDLAVDLSLADERVKNTGSRAFIEGNLFTYAADGVAFDINKSRLSFVESMELLAFLYSGGRTSSDFYKKLRGENNRPGLCQTGGGLDLNDEPKLDRKCVGKQMGNLIVDYGVNMPGMNEFMRTAPVEERDLLVKNLMDSAFSPKNSHTDWVEYSELSIMAVVLHYIEAVLTRFDANRDGVLTNPEIRKAIPVFVGYIQRFAKDRLGHSLSDRAAQGAFLYILLYKQVPTAWNIIKIYDLSLDMAWEWDVRGVKVRVDMNQPLRLNRAELSTVFRVIVAKIFDTAPVAEQIKLLSAPHPAACQEPPLATPLDIVPQVCNAL
jgi:hypothetical protein